jgi:hypothetical protein
MNSNFNHIDTSAHCRWCVENFLGSIIGMSSFITSITKGRKKTPEQLVRLALRDLFDITESQDPAVVELKSGAASPQEDLCKRLSQLKVLLYGDGERSEVDEDKVVEVSRRIQEVFPTSTSIE